jgi:hypothetical protein
MGHIVTPAVPFVHQLPSLCGAACAQMILAAVGKAATTPVEQIALWHEVQNATAGPVGSQAPFTPCGHFPKQICESCNGGFCWCTFPDALVNVLNDRLGHVLYKRQEHTTETDATDCVLDNVDTDIATPVLVRERQHWIVVHGYETGAGAGTNFGGRNVTSLLVHNPEWLCPRQGIVVSEWCSDYLQKITCGSFSGHIVMLGTVARRKSRAPIKKDKSVGLLPVDVIRRLANVEQARLIAVPYWSQSFERATAGTPLFVRSLEGPARDYFIVDFAANGVSTGRLIIGAQDGELREISGIDTAAQPLPPVLSTGHLVPGAMPTLPVEQPELVWKFCDQSKTPFLPFYAVTEGGITVYVRVDGQRFTELTNRSAG